ncbi:MAG: polysaccharide deacetylase family protein [Pirellulaceae bacterium]
MLKKLDADLSLDLDNKWAYLRTHGDERWESLPSYLPFVVPHILQTLQQLDLTITFFIVGQDAELSINDEALTSIAEAKHEIANHSFSHEPWLQRYSHEQLGEEFERTEAALAKYAKHPLVGFRAPGYSLSGDVLEMLCERGYQYDCSTLPTYLGPAARAYYIFKSSFSKDQAQDRKDLFGSFSDGFRSLRPYYWSTPAGEILELPVSTIPIVRTPFHFSYLHYLSQFSKLASRMYLAMALTVCKLTRTSPSLLLHPLDFLGADEVPELDFFPGMRQSGDTKRKYVANALRGYSRAFNVLPMMRRAEQLALKKDKLPRVTRLPHR